MQDHLWGDRDEISSKERKRKMAIAYQEELKKQMIEQESRKNLDNGYGNYRHEQRNSYDRYPSEEGLGNYGNRVSKPSYGQQNYSPAYSPSYGSSSGMATPSSSFANAYGSYSSQKYSSFAESLRAQIDAASRTGSATEVSIPPLSTVAPTVPSSFSGSTHFNEAQFEFTPNMTRSWRNYNSGNVSRISPISMYSTSSLRSQFNSSFDTVTRVDTSSLRKSKIGTPQSGFSMRATSNLSSTWGGNTM